MSRPRYRAILVDPEFTITDTPDYVKDTPADAFTAGLGALLTRLFAVLAGEAVIVLTSAAVAALRRCGPATDPAPWKAGADGPFIRYELGDGKRSVIVAEWERMAESRCPLWHPDLSMIDFIGRLSAWHTATGYAYRGTPGVAGTAILRGVLEGRRKTPDPRWFLSHKEDAWTNAEQAYHPRQWGREPEAAEGSGVWEHEYDIRHAYPAAMSSVYVARDDLRHRPDVLEFDPSLAGFWLVDIEAWTIAELPDPAGYPTARRAGRRTRWVTSPTLALLDQLGADGVHPGYKIRDAWLAKGYQELKPFRLMLRDATRTVTPDPDADPGQLDAIAAGLKLCAQEALGMAARNGGRTYRPDWWAAVIAQARSNLWRKLWTARESHNSVPLRVKTDAVYYLSNAADPYVAKAARALDVRRPENVEPGKFKVDPGKSREVAA